MLVRIFQSPTVQKAFMLARMYESTNLSTTVPNSGQVNKNRGILGPKSLLSDKIAVTQNHDQPKSTVRNSQTLTPAYMSERRSKNLCYFCNEPYTPGHTLTHKKLQVHVLEQEWKILRIVTGYLIPRGWLKMLVIHKFHRSYQLSYNEDYRISQKTPSTYSAGQWQWQYP